MTKIYTKHNGEFIVNESASSIFKKIFNLEDFATFKLESGKNVHIQKNMICVIEELNK